MQQHQKRLAGLEAAALRGAAAGGHLLRCRSSTMSPHRLRRVALHLPAPGAPQVRRCSRQNVNLLLREPLGRVETERLKTMI